MYFLFCVCKMNTFLRIYFQTKEPKTSNRASYSSKSDQSGVSLPSVELDKFKRELRESALREKDLRKQIESLTTTIRELTKEIEEKEQVLRDLQLQFERQVHFINCLYSCTVTQSASFFPLTPYRACVRCHQVSTRCY